MNFSKLLLSKLKLHRIFFLKNKQFQNKQIKNVRESKSHLLKILILLLFKPKIEVTYKFKFHIIVTAILPHQVIQMETESMSQKKRTINSKASKR